MQALLVKLDWKWQQLVISLLILVNKDDISELTENSNAESTNRQIEYAVSRVNSYRLLNKLI